MDAGIDLYAASEVCVAASLGDLERIKVILLRCKVHAVAMQQL